MNSHHTISFLLILLLALSGCEQFNPNKKAYKENIGIATYKNNFFDEMTNPDLEGIEIEYR